MVVAANEPVLVQHRLQNNADLNVRLKYPGKPNDNMATPEFAEYLASVKKRDMSRVLEVFKSNMIRRSSRPPSHSSGRQLSFVLGGVIYRTHDLFFIRD